MANKVSSKKLRQTPGGKASGCTEGIDEALTSSLH